MKKVKYFRCLLTEDEDSVLKILAQNVGLSNSDFISMLVKQDAKKRGLLSRPGKYVMIGEGGGRLGK
ncbi:MAG: hypothetical protein Q8P24_05255 [Desulfobacterales bacterium]|nr:hypothetical protein [Desulfobacterales bacterium]